MLFEYQTTLVLDFDAVATAGKTVYGVKIPAPKQGYLHTIVISLEATSGAALTAIDVYSDLDVLLDPEVFISSELEADLNSTSNPTEAKGSILTHFATSLINAEDLNLTYFRPYGVPYAIRNKQFETDGLPILFRPETVSGEATVNLYVAIAEVRY